MTMPGPLPPTAVAVPPTAVGVPPAPPGPGVQPPFVAPPTDGARQRRWLAIGLTIATALLCCVGGLGGLGGLVVLGGQAIVGETKTTVSRYLTAIEKAEYGQ